MKNFLANIFSGQIAPQIAHQNAIRSELYQTRKKIEITDEEAKELEGLEDNDVEKLINSGKQLIQDYFDNLIIRKKETPQIEYYRRGVQRIFDMVESRYGFKLTNNDVLEIDLKLQDLSPRELATDYASIAEIYKEYGDLNGAYEMLTKAIETDTIDEEDSEKIFNIGIYLLSFCCILIS